MGLYSYYLFGDLSKMKKKYGILTFFLTQDHMQLEISKCYFPNNFHWNPSKIYENIGFHGKSECLLEYRNESWHLVPKIIYSI